MKFQLRAFNIYLLLVVLGGFGIGCQTSEEKEARKEMTALSFHLEANFDGTQRTKIITLLRANPVQISIEASPFLDERIITNAAVVDIVGGFAIQVHCDERGGKWLESVTAANRGRRIAIFSRWDEERWLAAPRIARAVADGVYLFTPDASREEAERIVRGLVNAHREYIRKTRTFLN